MHGNVWEFCADEWFEDYNNAPVDDSPRVKSLTPGHQEEPFHSARGGSWHETPAHCRSAMRLRVDKEDRMEVYGMRVSLII